MRLALALKAVEVEVAGGVFDLIKRLRREQLQEK
jgi:hypothetical protein